MKLACVQVRDLGFAYTATGEPVLADLWLDVEPGSVHAIVGPNGCGKSTLLRLIAGLEQPTSGTLEVTGGSHQSRTALVFQDPRLIPWWNVDRNIAIGVEFSEKPPELYRKVRDFYTKRVGLDAVGTRKPAELSLGQRTVAALGRGLAHDADVLLLDEPFAHLDAITRSRFYDEFETHWQLEPRTAILVTHDVAEAVTLADRVSIMRHGPGPLVDTVLVTAERPRVGISPTHPGLRTAIGQVWEALGRADQ